MTHQKSCPAEVVLPRECGVTPSAAFWAKPRGDNLIRHLPVAQDQSCPWSRWHVSPSNDTKAPVICRGLEWPNWGWLSNLCQQVFFYLLLAGCQALCWWLGYTDGLLLFLPMRDLVDKRLDFCGCVTTASEFFPHVGFICKMEAHSGKGPQRSSPKWGKEHPGPMILNLGSLNLV